MPLAVPPPPELSEVTDAPIYVVDLLVPTLLPWPTVYLFINQGLAPGIESFPLQYHFEEHNLSPRARK